MTKEMREFLKVFRRNKSDLGKTYEETGVSNWRYKRMLADSKDFKDKEQEIRQEMLDSVEGRVIMSALGEDANTFKAQIELLKGQHHRWKKEEKSRQNLFLNIDADTLGRLLGATGDGGKPVTTDFEDVTREAIKKIEPPEKASLNEKRNIDAPFVPRKANFG